MLKSQFPSELNSSGRATFLTHGRTSETYEKPSLVELGNILTTTQGLFSDDDDSPPTAGKQVATQNNG